MINNTNEFVELLARRRAERLAALVKGQPQSFWDAISAKLDAAPDGMITMDDVMAALRERELDE
ncbi:hypothetical protein [Rhizobium ruizarguesonis]|uniref:hypothetical protein n=1 Tax=Rhizobium ruizarguesonis TaxID=2081791 RepID=UPI001CF3FDA7|nr:hypothetical protein [Rhizobium ruizarguesonis]MCB2403568.1 hypothetical protein [Rhizobium ruizarguesonis]